MKILVINGPNINMLGVREPEIYGFSTYQDLCDLIMNHTLGHDIQIFQSNHEGEIVDKIQQAYGVFDALIINPAAYTHTSIAILDALKAVGLPTVEVHISNINERETFRKVSFVGLYAEKTICGMGLNGYLSAIDYLISKY